MMVPPSPRILAAMFPGWEIVGQPEPASWLVAEHPAIGRATAEDMGDLVDWIRRLTARYETVRAEANAREEPSLYYDGPSLVSPIDLPSGPGHGAQDSGPGPDPYLNTPGRGYVEP